MCNESNKRSLRKITIITTGSRGDIQPFVAIGIALKRAGYIVRVLTNPSETHTMLLNDFGIDHVPYGVDFDQYTRKDKLARSCMETGDFMSLMEGLKRALLDHTELYCKPYNDEMMDKTQRPDLLIVSFLDRFFGLYAKHVLRIPTIEIKLQHWVFDDPSRAPSGLPTLPLGMHKYILTKLILPGEYKKYEKLVKGIESIKGTNSSATVCLTDFLLWDQWLDSELNHSPLLPMLVTQSSFFKDILCPTLPPSSNIRFVGPAIIEKCDQLDGNARSFGDNFDLKKLKEFISSDPNRKPVYMGWGSMIRKSTHEMVLDFRTLIVFLYDLHCAAALRSGVPTIVTPVFADQHDNAFVVQNLGVGVGFEQQLQKIDAESLSEAIDVVSNNSAMASRAKEVAEQIREQRGCREILQEIEKYWKHNVVTGEFFKEIQDWRLVTKKKKLYNERRSLVNHVIFGSAFAIASAAFIMKQIETMVLE